MYNPIFNIQQLDASQRAEVVRNSPYFDEAWYRNEYPEIEYHSEGNPDPAYHYANYGYQEQRLPSVLFDGNRYSLEHNLRDVNPLLHYLACGSKCDYRLYERRNEILCKFALGLSDELFPCERIMCCEFMYQKQHLTANFDLCSEPDTLSGKLYALQALGDSKYRHYLADSKDLHLYLQNAGVDNRYIPTPALTVPEGQTQIDWEHIPDFFRLQVNGTKSSFILGSKQDARKDAAFAAKIEQLLQLAQVTLHQNPMHPYNKLSKDLIFFGEQDPIVALVKDSTERKQSCRIFPLEIWCANGKFLCAIVHAANTRTVLDRDGKILPTSISCDSSGFRPVDITMQSITGFDNKIEQAEKLASDSDFLAVTFLCAADSETALINDLTYLPLGGAFVFSNGYDHKFGAKLSLS